MIVGLYVRVSTQEQANEGYSIGEQIDRLTKYCEAMGWRIYKTYTDPGYSGGDTNRPGLQELVKDVKAHKLDKVVVYKLDRLSRSQKDTLILIEDVLIAHNVDFVSVSESFDTSTPVGRAVLGLLAVFAQLEREQIKERMSMGKQARAKEGKFNGGTEPIGYDYNVAENILEVNEYEAMQIRELFDLFLKGTPLRTIETLFLKKGYKHKHGTWTPKAIKRCMSHKLYLGYINYRGEDYKAEHPPIIDEETFNKANELLAERKENYIHTGAKPGAQSTYLGGMLYCKHCGGKYAKTHGGSRKYGVRYYYACYSRSKKVKKMVKDPSCMNKYWRMEDLDKLVFDEIKKLAIDPEYIHEIRHNKNKESDTPNKIDIINREIATIDNQISRFMDLYGLGTFTIEQVSEKVDPLNTRKNNLLKELENLNAESGELSVESAIEIFKTFDEVLERGDFDEIRLLIERLIYYIELDEDDVYIHWKFA